MLYAIKLFLLIFNIREAIFQNFFENQTRFVFILFIDYSNFKNESSTVSAPFFIFFHFCVPFSLLNRSVTVSLPFFCPINRFYVPWAVFLYHRPFLPFLVKSSLKFWDYYFFSYLVLWGYCNLLSPENCWVF